MVRTQSSRESLVQQDGFVEATELEGVPRGTALCPKTKFRRRISRR